MAPLVLNRFYPWEQLCNIPPRSDGHKQQQPLSFWGVIARIYRGKPVCQRLDFESTYFERDTTGFLGLQHLPPQPGQGGVAAAPVGAFAQDGAMECGFSLSSHKRDEFAQLSQIFSALCFS